MRRLGFLLIGLAFTPIVLGADVPEKPILVLEAGGHTALVRKVLFTPDGRELITVSDDKTIRVWDVASGEPLRVLRPPIGRGPEGMLYAAALSPDGQTLAVGGCGNPAGHWGQIYLITLASGRIERVLKGHTSENTALAFAPDGQRLASGSNDLTARIWEIASGRAVQVLRGHEKPISSLAWSPDGTRLATAYDNTARVWSAKTGVPQALLQGHKDWVRCMAWRPDGRILVTGDFVGTIRVWGPDGTTYRGFDNLGGIIGSLTFTADSSRLLVTTNVPSCFLLDLATGGELTHFDLHEGGIFASALSPDGTLVATADTLGVVHLWRITDGTPVLRLASRGSPVYSAGWSPDGTTVAWGNTSRYVSNNDRGPLERTFRLTDLSFGSPPDDSFLRAQIARGTLSLELTDRSTVAVRRAGTTVAKERKQNNFPIC